MVVRFSHMKDRDPENDVSLLVRGEQDPGEPKRR